MERAPPLDSTLRVQTDVLRCWAVGGAGTSRRGGVSDPEMLIQPRFSCLFHCVVCPRLCLHQVVTTGMHELLGVARSGPRRGWSMSAWVPCRAGDGGYGNDGHGWAGQAVSRAVVAVEDDAFGV